MTYAPATLQALRSYLVGKGAPVLGIVGNPATHKRGYHIGSPLLPGDYSGIQPRDKAGLSGAASAIDIGRFNGLIELGRHLYAEKPYDVRELIAERGDGSQLWRWDDVTGATTGNPASAELYHHLHVSYYRDSERRTKLPPYERFFAPEDIVKVYSVPGIVSAEAPAGTPYYDSPTDTTPNGKTGGPGRYLLVGQDKPTDPTRYLVDGVGNGTSALMSWLPADALTGRLSESFNSGVTAAAAAAATAKRT
jgi:hypothetical protein